MIAVDTNLLVYAHRRDSPFYAAASALIAELAEGPAAWAIPWPCVHEFFSVVTNPRAYVPPTPLNHAIQQMDEWMRSPTVVLMAESEGYWKILQQVLSASRVSGGLVHDARICALCLHHGVRELWSADRDFSRFRGLAVVNPLVGRQR